MANVQQQQEQSSHYYMLAVPSATAWDPQEATAFTTSLVDALGSPAELSIVANVEQILWVIGDHAQAIVGEQLRRIASMYYPGVEVIGVSGWHNLLGYNSLENLPYPFWRSWMFYGLEYPGQAFFSLRTAEQVRELDPLTVMTRLMDELQSGERLVYSLFLAERMKLSDADTEAFLTKSVFEAGMGPRAALYRDGFVEGLARIILESRSLAKTRVPRFSSADEKLVRAKMGNPMRLASLYVQMDTPDPKQLDVLGMLVPPLRQLSSPHAILRDLPTGFRRSKIKIENPEQAAKTDATTTLIDWINRTVELRGQKAEQKLVEAEEFVEAVTLTLSPSEIAALWHLPHRGFTAERIAWAGQFIPMKESTPTRAESIITDEVAAQVDAPTPEYTDDLEYTNPLGTDFGKQFQAIATAFQAQVTHEAEWQRAQASIAVSRAAQERKAREGFEQAQRFAQEVVEALAKSTTEADELLRQVKLSQAIRTTQPEPTQPRTDVGARAALETSHQTGNLAFKRLQSAVNELHQLRIKLARRKGRFLMVAAGASIAIIVALFLAYRAISEAYRDWMRENRYEDAIALVEEGDWAKAREGLAQILTEVPDYEDAKTYFDIAFYRAAELHAESGVWVRAGEALSAAATEDPNFSNAQVILGGQTFSAPLALQQIQYQTAESLAAEQEWEQARGILEPLYRLYPESEPIRALYFDTVVRIAQAHLQASEWQAARDEAQRLLGLDAENQQAASIVRDSYYQAAQFALDAEDWPVVHAELQSLLAAFPNDQDAMVLLKESYYQPGQAHVENQEWELAQAELGELFELDPEYRDTASLLSEAYITPVTGFMEEQNWTAARDLLTRWIALMPESEEAHSLLRESYYRPAVQLVEAGEWEQARPILLDLTYLDADYKGASQLLRESYYAPAAVHLDAGEYAEARAILEELLALDPSYRNAEKLLQDTYLLPALEALEAGRWPEARTELTALLELVPEQTDASAALRESYYRPARAALDAQDWEGARAELAALFEIDSGYRDGQTLLRESYYRPAKAALENGQWEQARSELENLFEIDEAYADAQTLLRETYYRPAMEHIQNEEWHRAAEELAALQAIDPNYRNLPEIIDAQPELQRAMAGLYADLLRAETGGHILHTLRGHASAVSSLAFSADGSQLISAAGDGTIRIWQVSDGQSVSVLEGGASRVTSAVLSADGTLLASGGDDNNIDLWDTRTGEMAGTLAGHSDWITDLAFSPDGAFLASSSDDGTAILWDLNAREPIHQVGTGIGQMTTVTLNADFSLMASGADDSVVYLWSPESGDLINTLRGHTSWITDLAFSPLCIPLEGQGEDCTALLASSSSDGTVRVWNVTSGELVYLLEGHVNWVRGVAFGPDGSLLASTGRDGVVMLWDTATGLPVRIVNRSLGDARSVAISPDGTSLAAGGQDGDIWLWTLR